ncbi:MAG: hypothetical protein MUC53_05105 [Candidatus Contendobacter sp.]|nr:hypothetical protein [Candidatus Contendobacter sp.]
MSGTRYQFSWFSSCTASNGRWPALLREVGPFGAFNGLLTEWSLQDSRPLRLTSPLLLHSH